MQAIAAVGVSLSMPAAAKVAAGKRPSRTAQVGLSYRRIGNGFRYPEQSSRQAMRRHRRAQGGVGIDLCPHRFEYRDRLFEIPF